MSWAVGDLAIVSFIHSASYNPGPPTGWTKIGNGSGSSAGGGNSIGIASAWRIMDGTETNAGIWGMAGSNPYWSGLFLFFSGAHATAPIGLFTNASVNSGGGLCAWGAITPTTSNKSWVIALGWNNTPLNMVTPPTGLTHRVRGTYADEHTVHDSNGGTTGWAGGSVDYGGSGVGGRQSFEIKSAGGDIAFQGSHFSGGQGHSTPLSLPPMGEPRPDRSRVTIIG